MFVCLVLRSGHRALHMRPLGHSINGWSTQTHTNTHSQVWLDKILCLRRDWFPRCPPASACLPASPSALWFPPTCVRFPKCVWVSDPPFSSLWPAISTVCRLWSQSHSSIEWHGRRHQRPGHSLIPLGPISSQSRGSLPDWLPWLMPNARRGSPQGRRGVTTLCVCQWWISEIVPVD